MYTSNLYCMVLYCIFIDQCQALEDPMSLFMADRMLKRTEKYDRVAQLMALVAEIRQEVGGQLFAQYSTVCTGTMQCSQCSTVRYVYRSNGTFRDAC